MGGGADGVKYVVCSEEKGTSLSSAGAGATSITGYPSVLLFLRACIF